MIYFVVVAVLVAATALLIRLFVFAEPEPIHDSDLPLPPDSQSSTALSRMNTALPTEWNDAGITNQLISLRERPPVLAHFVDSVIGRFIIGQNDKTAEKRTHLIRTVIDQLNARKDLQVAIDNLQIHSLERAIRFKEKEIEHASLADRLARLQEVEDLRREKEKLELQVDIARLQQEKRNYEKVEEPTKPKQTREEAREAKKKQIKQAENEAAEAMLDVTKGVPFDQLSSDDQDRVMRIQNFHNDKKIRLDEELARI